VLEFLKRLFRSEHPADQLIGAARSPLWSWVRDDYAKKYPKCAVCQRREIEVHHIAPFHLFPERELDTNNLISLCRPHHELVGHLMDWKSWNANVRTDAMLWRQRILDRPRT
jgi:5-methylcytosine-specific restriction endonuclease McrA